MKNILAIIGGVSILLSIMGYTTTNNELPYNQRLIIPLKQKGIVVTTNSKTLFRLITKGWVVQDVDVIHYNALNNVEKYYTLIKY